MALKQIKNKIISVKKTGQVTKAMESVSAVKMRKSQERAFLSRPYVHASLRILERLADSAEGLSHPLTKRRPAGTVLLVMVTSDKGLAGSVNSAVLKQAERAIATHRNVEIIAIGRKAVDFARRERKTVVAEFTNVTDGVTLEDVSAMTKAALLGYEAGTYSSVEVLYQNFISTFEQAPTRRQVLPLDPSELHYILRGIKPKTGKFSEDTLPADKKTTFTIEPSAEEVLARLIPQLVQVILYHAMLESKASEHSARMVAMKNATDKSKEVAKSLTLMFNKARQAAITAEVAEITGGMEAMK